MYLQRKRYSHVLVLLFIAVAVLMAGSTIEAKPLIAPLVAVTGSGDEDAISNTATDVETFAESSVALAVTGNFIKTIFATSEPDSSDIEDGSDSGANARPVLIGEVVTYQLTFSVTEGTTNSVSIVETLPLGLQYIAGSVNASVTNAGWVLAAPVVTGGTSSGDDVTFSFGDINNTDNDADVEQIIVTFDVVVNNIVGNRDGVGLANVATLTAAGQTDLTSEERWVTIVEPLLTLTKTINLSYENTGLIGIAPNDAADAGDEFTYRIRLTNNGIAPAYDVLLVDYIPIEYLQQFGTVITTSSVSSCCFTFNSGTGLWNFGWPVILPGQSPTVDIRVRVLNDVAPGESWDNTGEITYNSLPDANGTNNNVPGALGDDDGGRTGDVNDGGTPTDLTDDTFDPVNYYGAIATSPVITVPDPIVTKQVEHPSQTPVVTDPSILYGNPAGTNTQYQDSSDDPNTGVSAHSATQLDIGIGEEFSYLVVVTFPEGTAYNVTMIDLASPNGHIGGLENHVIEIISAEVIWVGGNLTLEPSILGVGGTFIIEDATPADGDGTRSQFFAGQLRNVLNTPDDVTNDDDRYIIRIRARVDDEDDGTYNSGASDDTVHNNRDGDVGGNRLQFQWNNQLDITMTQQIIARNDIVEPNLTIDKVTNTAMPVDAGDTVQFTLTVSNAGTAPAYNIVLEDLYPTELGDEMILFDSIDLGASTCDDIAGWTVTQQVGPTLTTFEFDELLAGANCNIVLNTMVQGEIGLDQTYTNTATITAYTSTPEGFGHVDNRLYPATPVSDTSTFTTSQPTITIDDVIQVEGDTGTSNFTFTVSLSSASSQEITVDYVTADGTANSGSDYTAITTTTLTFNPGVTTQTIDVAVSGDTLVESDETFTVNLSNPINATLADNQGLGTIEDDETSAGVTVSVSGSDPDAAENPANNGEFTIQMSTTNTTGSPVVVTYALSGTATEGADYASLPGTVSIPSGSDSAVVTVVTAGFDDALVEGTETVILTLIGTSNVAVTVNPVQDTAVVSIADDDVTSSDSVSIAASDPNAVENPTDSGQFTVALSNVIGGDVTITYAIGGDATNGTDYTAITNTVMITAGNSSAVIDILPLDDVLFEGDEIVTLTLLSTDQPSVGVDVAQAEATVTIADDEAGVWVYASDNFASENGDTAEFTIQMSTPNTTGSPLTLTYTLSGNAVMDEDYTILTGSAIIPQNSDRVTLPIIPINDDVPESLENVILTLVSTSDPLVLVADAPDNTAEIQIGDNDQPTDDQPTDEDQEISVFDPAISKIGYLVPGQVGVTGEQLEWIITVTNLGTATGTNIEVLDNVDPRLQINDVVTPAKVQTVIADQTVIFTISSLVPDESVTFSIFTTVLEGATVENTVCLTADTISGQVCATGLAVVELPATGETPWWRELQPIRMLALILSGLVASWWIRRRWLMTHA